MGRPRGSKNKNTLLQQRAFAKAERELRSLFGDDADDGGVVSKEHLIVYLTTSRFDAKVRLGAAKAWLEYTTPRMLPVRTDEEGRPLRDDTSSQTAQLEIVWNRDGAETDAA